MGFWALVSGVEVDLDVGLAFLEGVVGLGTSLSSVRFRFLDLEEEVDLTMSLPNHDGPSGIVSSTGMAFDSSSSGLGRGFPRKARAFFFLLESLSPAIVIVAKFVYFA